MAEVCQACGKFIPTKSNPITAEDYLSRYDCYICVKDEIWWFKSGPYLLSNFEKMYLYTYDIYRACNEEFAKKELLSRREFMERALRNNSIVRGSRSNLSRKTSYSDDEIKVMKSGRGVFGRFMNEKIIRVALAYDLLDESVLPKEVFDYILSFSNSKNARN